MGKSLTVPSGWKKGEPIIVRKQREVWFIELPFNPFGYRDMPSDAIASMWFYKWEEFAEWIQWWNE